MLNTVSKVVIEILGVILVIAGLYIWYLSYEVEGSKSTIKKMATKAVVSEIENIVEQIENNQTIIFTKEKEAKNEEIPGAIGFHTITSD